MAGVVSYGLTSTLRRVGDALRDRDCRWGVRWLSCTTCSGVERLRVPAVAGGCVSASVVSAEPIAEDDPKEEDPTILDPSQPVAAIMPYKQD